MIWFCFAACGYCPPYSIYFRIWILQDHVTACVQFSMIFLFSVLFSSLFVIVFVWQGTHYWWWLSPLSRLVLRVETLVVFIRMFVFVFVDCLRLLLEMVFDLLLLIRIHICLIRVHNPIHWFLTMLILNTSLMNYNFGWQFSLIIMRSLIRQRMR